VSDIFICYMETNKVISGQPSTPSNITRSRMTSGTVHLEWRLIGVAILMRAVAMRYEWSCYVDKSLHIAPFHRAHEKHIKVVRYSRSPFNPDCCMQGVMTFDWGERQSETATVNRNPAKSPTLTPMRRYYIFKAWLSRRKRPRVSILSLFATIIAPTDGFPEGRDPVISCY
jgi:hypothetical protein